MSRPNRIAQFGALPRDHDRDAALVDVRHPERTRDDIVLAAELSQRLDRVAAEYRAQDALAKHGLVPKTRLLFVGPPGCGKTLCAEILAGDLGLPLLYARFDGIISSFLGETANNLRRVFNYAEQHVSVLFFDEFDALGKRRDDPHEVGELKRVVGSFLQILDSFPRDHIVVAATNHEGLLDEALWRRFDEILYFGKPSDEQLERLLTLRLRAVRKRQIDLQALVKEMSGFTFADAERVCFEATKAMILAGGSELTQDVLLTELAEQRQRLKLAAGRPSS
jgi:SpoVK/Ycf46/Vps4 family AAA+-type ATPase